MTHKKNNIKVIPLTSGKTRQDENNYGSTPIVEPAPDSMVYMPGVGMVANDNNGYMKRLFHRLGIVIRKDPNQS